jgi:ubiquitin carboxyl-terminal hydrolase L5
MARYSAAELHFSLMALTRDRLEMCEEQIEELDGLLLSLPENAVERQQLNNDRTALQHKLHMEQEKRARWHVSDGRLEMLS